MQQPMNFFTNVWHPADRGGCSHYRGLFQSWLAQTLRHDIRVIESTKFIPIPEFYKDIRSVRIQRQIADEQASYILNFLKPVSNRYGFWLMYEIDDVIGMDDIPKYNSGWEAYQNPQLMQNVVNILSVCDFVTVTTKTLGNYFVKKFNVPKDRIVVVPNYIPKWWFDGLYNIDQISKRFDDHKEKRTICFASSTTHFDIYNRANGADDFEAVNSFVRANIDKYNWIFMGGIPIQLQDLAKDGKFKFLPGYDILNYPKEMNKLNIDVVIAPLRDNIFNNCKSNIKFIEMAALGVPCICQNLTPYRDYTDLVFNNNNDLQNQIDRLFKSKEDYLNIVKRDRDIVDNGNSLAPAGWWLENNMNIWFDLFSMPQKTLAFDLTQKRDQPQPAPTQPKKLDVNDIVFNRE
jgi:O-antigen biosynthesis protein